MAEKQIIIIGGGLAGLTAALNCAEFAQVTVLYKTGRDSTASAWAQGGIAVVQSQGDSFEAHIQDTLRSGAGLSHPEVVRKCIEAAPERLEELRSWGVTFDESLHKEGGHQHHRIAHVGDRTGQATMSVLLKRASSHPKIRLLEKHFAIDAILADDGSVRGVYVYLSETGRIEPFAADALILATGGAGKVYLYTSNPPTASGDGLGLALRAGCRLADMEFFQFHPTLLYHHDLPHCLITEAVRGAGAVLLDQHQEPFTDSLATRDTVARAIDKELKQSGQAHVWLDCRSVPNLKEHFPQLSDLCAQIGLDPRTELIPVVPGAHYCCGGIVTRLSAETDLPGLLAVGEVACTGLHGANRLASNSLLEALVFGHEAAKTCRRLPVRQKDPLPRWDYGAASDQTVEEVLITHLWEEVRRLMWNFVGIVRSDFRLEKALNRLRLLNEEVHELYWSVRPTLPLLELRNLALTAQVIAEAAHRRRESRGLHFTLDYPQTSDDYLGSFHCRLDLFGRLQWNWVSPTSST